MRFIIKSLFFLALAAWFTPMILSHDEKAQASNAIQTYKQQGEQSLMKEVGAAVVLMIASVFNDVKQVKPSFSKSQNTLTRDDLLPAWKGGKRSGA